MTAVSKLNAQFCVTRQRFAACVAPFRRFQVGFPLDAQRGAIAQAIDANTLLRFA